MTKIIYDKYDKRRLTDLPVAEFTGKIVLVQSEKEANKAVDFLLTQPILGVDTETRPSFKKGHMNKVALLQVSTEEICFLFRLTYIGLCPGVLRLLTNTKVPMVGLSWHDDLTMLHRRGDFEAGRFVDIQDLIGAIGIEDMSLQKLYANLFGQKISKRQRLTNWDADVLTDRQKLYAATDAWATLNLYNEIRRLTASGDYTLMRTPKPENNLTEHV